MLSKDFWYFGRQNQYGQVFVIFVNFCEIRDKMTKLKVRQRQICKTFMLAKRDF